MPKKFDVSKKNVLLNPERAKRLDVHRIMATVPILTYHQVADVGCGPGFFTVPLAKYLFDGKVFAIDVQPEMLDACQSLVKEFRLTNVEYLHSKESQLPLETSSLDGVFMAFVLQEANAKKALLKDVTRVLKKGGWLAILEWYKKDTENGPPIARKIPMEEMRKATEALGFRFTSRLEINRDQYMIVMRK